MHHVPGHSSGSVFYMHRGLSAVFTGDRSVATRGDVFVGVKVLLCLS